MKAVLVIDMPKVCADCEYLLKSTDGYNYCSLTQCFCSKDLDAQNEKEPWCPLKPMPEKKEPFYDININDYDIRVDGWNDCIDEILGEEDGSET